MPKLKLYSVKVRLAGELTNEVWKDNVTAAEIKLLEKIHEGPNYAIAEIKHTGAVERTDVAERGRLLRLYREYKLGTGDKLLRDVLGFDTPLPVEYTPPVYQDFGDGDVEDEIHQLSLKDQTADEHVEQLAEAEEIYIPPKPERTRVPRRAAAQPAPAPEPAHAE